MELSAAYNQEQVYYYELDANRNVDYQVKSIEIVYTDDGESQSVLLPMLVSRVRLWLPLVWAGSMF